MRCKIANAATDLRAQHKMQDAFPLDPITLANRMGIEVRATKFKSDWISGGIHNEKGKAVIYIKANELPTRQRFTVAHELGHYVLHMKELEKGLLEKVDMFRSTETSQREVEANEFAAALLMPEPAVRKFWNLYGSIEILADMFCVSLSAMSYRLYKLGLQGEW